MSYITDEQLSALRIELDQRFANVTTQLAVLSNRITTLQNSLEVTTFPSEAAQIRASVRTAFADELTVFVNDLNTIKSNIVDLQEAAGII